jgi:hypothetical protein
LSALEGLAWGSQVRVPFLHDIEVHVRYLIALPLLIYAELTVNQRMLPLVQNFVKRKLVPEKDLGRLNQAVESVLRLRNSMLAEIFLLVLVYGVGVFVIWRNYGVLHTASWYATADNTGAFHSTWSGLWYRFLSIPIFQFILIRWYFRLVIWYIFLWKVSRIKLELVPTHPDRAGGLGFLSVIVFAFAPLLLAHGTLLSGMIANRIFFVGARLPQFKIEIFVMVLVLLCLTLGPLLVFAPQLLRTKRIGLGEYGTLALGYAREFDQKWLRGGAPANEALIGSADIQSLADLGNSYQVIREMRLAPFTKEAILQLAVITLLPLLPLALTMFSFEQLLDRFMGTVF